MKKTLKIIGIVVLAIIAVALIAFGVFWYRNIHWFDKYEKALAKVSAEEKQVMLPNGNVINYGDDLIWFIDNVICEKTVVAGHSNGAITAAYVAAYGGENISGVVLEDPPIFNTEGEDWENYFAYRDTYKNIHEY